MAASEINLNDTSPAAPAGQINVKWQKGSISGTDPVSGFPIAPVSAYVPLGAGLTPVQETPTGVQDNVNVTQTLSFAPNPAASLVVTRNGVVQDQTRWVTLSGSTITWTVAPKPTDKIRAYYTH